jgi:hypothetical protein
VNLRVAERDDIDFLAECDNDINCMGEYVLLVNRGRSQIG